MSPDRLTVRDKAISELMRSSYINVSIIKRILIKRQPSILKFVRTAYNGFNEDNYEYWECLVWSFSDSNEILGAIKEIQEEIDFTSKNRLNMDKYQLEYLIVLGIAYIYSIAIAIRKLFKKEDIDLITFMNTVLGIDSSIENPYNVYYWFNKVQEFIEITSTNPETEAQRILEHINSLPDTIKVK